VSAWERFIHPIAQHELDNPAGPGGRHEQIKRIAVRLAGDGWPSDEIFERLRPLYTRGSVDSVPDYEIRSICDWAVAQGFSPSYGNNGHGTGQEYWHTKTQPLSEEEKLELWIQTAERYLGGFRATEADLWEVSPIRPSERLRDDARLLVGHLYEPDELVNVNADPHFIGAGEVATADQWRSHWALCAPPQTDSGCWVRMNPVRGRKGSGASDSYTDGDIAVFKYILLESDKLPLELQLSLFARLKLPIVLILDSGGRSYHAWVRTQAADAQDYRAEADHLCSTLERFGIDQGNKNPSRYSRLPGVMRTLGARKRAGLPEGTPTAQRIVFLNPHPKEGSPIL
jgi:hypothetical protein